MPERTCSIPGCAVVHYARGYCKRHYDSWRTNGDPLAATRVRGDDRARFWQKVQKTETCWLWMGNLHRGYGKFSIGRVMHLAHRVAYEWMIGPIPDGLTIDHRCHKATECRGGVKCPHRRCVNPSHLKPATQPENYGRSQSQDQRTHCKRGHAYAFHGRIDSRGERVCRTCERERTRRKRARQRSAQ